MDLAVLTGTDLLVLIAGRATLFLWGARMARTGIIRAFGQFVQTNARKILIAIGTRRSHACSASK